VPIFKFSRVRLRVYDYASILWRTRYPGGTSNAELPSFRSSLFDSSMRHRWHRPTHSMSTHHASYGALYAVSFNQMSGQSIVVGFRRLQSPLAASWSVETSHVKPSTDKQKHRSSTCGLPKYCIAFHLSRLSL